MLGLLVTFILSWGILWLLAKEHVIILGITLNSNRLKEFLFGVVFMVIMCTINTLGQNYFEGVSYVQNPLYGISEGLEAVWWTLKAALFEELVFRGALLFILIRKLGVIKACIISSAAFGIYHWFSYGLIGGRIIPMVYVFFLTGAGGFMFAYAFAKTKSIYASFGLHFGWIVMSIVIFSAGPLGTQLFIPINEGTALNGWLTLVFFLWQAVVIPGIVVWYLQKKYLEPQIKTLD